MRAVAQPRARPPSPGAWAAALARRGGGGERSTAGMQEVGRSRSQSRGGKHAVEADEVSAWTRHQGRQSGEEVERLEQELAGAVAKGRLSRCTTKPSPSRPRRSSASGGRATGGATRARAVAMAPNRFTDRSPWTELDGLRVQRDRFLGCLPTESILPRHLSPDETRVESSSAVRVSCSSSWRAPTSRVVRRSVRIPLARSKACSTSVRTAQSISRAVSSL